MKMTTEEITVNESEINALLSHHWSILNVDCWNEMVAALDHHDTAELFQITEKMRKEVAKICFYELLKEGERIDPHELWRIK